MKKIQTKSKLSVKSAIISIDSFESFLDKKHNVTFDDMLKEILKIKIRTGKIIGKQPS